MPTETDDFPDPRHSTKSGIHKYDKVKAEEWVKAGKIPPPPDFGAPTHARWRGLLAKVVELARQRDLHALKGLQKQIEPKSSSQIAILNYLDLCIRALEQPNEVTRKQSEASESSTELHLEPTTSLIEKTGSTRDERASELVDRLSLWSGAAGFIPVPLVDVAAVWGVQLHMLRRLSEIYGVPFSENRGKSILTSLAAAAMPATTATTAASVMKGVPIIGTAIGALTMPAVSVGATWVIGKVFMKHFASGGTLLDFNPPDYREFIKSQKAKFAARLPARRIVRDVNEAARDVARAQAETEAFE